MNKSQLQNILKQVPVNTPIEVYFKDRYSIKETIAELDNISIEFRPNEVTLLKLVFTNYFKATDEINLETGEFLKIVDSSLITDDSLVVGYDHSNLYPLEHLEVCFSNSGYKLKLYLEEEIINERNSAA